MFQTTGLILLFHKVIILFDLLRAHHCFYKVGTSIKIGIFLLKFGFTLQKSFCFVHLLQYAADLVVTMLYSQSGIL